MLIQKDALQMIEKVGEFSSEVIELLDLNISAGTAIFIGDTNREHMKNSHHYEYEVYYHRIPKIISSPDYIGINHTDDSIEFIKKYGKHLKLAVRIANDGEYYARTLYTISTKRVENFVRSNTLIPIDSNKKK